MEAPVGLGSSPFRASGSGRMVLGLEVGDLGLIPAVAEPHWASTAFPTESVRSPPRSLFFYKCRSHIFYLKPCYFFIRTQNSNSGISEHLPCIMSLL